MANKNQTIKTIETTQVTDQAISNVVAELEGEALRLAEESKLLEAEQAVLEAEYNSLVDANLKTLNLEEKNHYSRIIKYVDQFGYKIDSTNLDDNWILIIGTTVDCQTMKDLGIDTKFFDNGYVLLSTNDGTIYKQVGDIRDGDFRCLPKYKSTLSPKVQKFCATQIERLTRNRVKAEESKKANKIKRDALLAELMG